MIKIIVCDDENIFLKIICEYLDRYFKKQKLQYSITCYDSSKQIINLSEKIKNYNIIFLDINMKDIDGIEIAKFIREYSGNIFIVFVTAFIKYSPEGYKVNATRYILKNTNTIEESIYECLDTIINKINQDGLIKNIEFVKQKKNININDILYIESRLHKLLYHLIINRDDAYYHYGVLNAIEKEYKDYGFLRVHQSYLVNIKHIKKIDNHNVIMDNGEMIPISKQRYKDIWDAYITYKGEL